MACTCLFPMYRWPRRSVWLGCVLVAAGQLGLAADHHRYAIPHRVTPATRAADDPVALKLDLALADGARENLEQLRIDHPLASLGPNMAKNE